MSTTAQQLLEAGYARSTANDPGKLATDAELLGRMNRTYQGLWALAARQRPDEFQTQSQITLVGGNGSYVLPDDTIDVRRLELAVLSPVVNPNARGLTVHLIPASEVTRLYHVAPCMYRVGNTLNSRMAPGDPVAGTLINIWLLLPGVTINALTTVLDTNFPTRHTEILSNDIGLYLSIKDEGRAPSDLAKLAADQSVKLAAFAQDYNLNASTLEFMHATAERVPMPAGGA